VLVVLQRIAQAVGEPSTTPSPEPLSRTLRGSALYCNVDRGNLIFGQKIPQTLSDIRVAGVDVGTACCLAAEIPLKTIIQIRFKVAVVKLE
jgi:hypothetical protein